MTANAPIRIPDHGRKPISFVSKADGVDESASTPVVLQSRVFPAVFQACLNNEFRTIKGCGLKNQYADGIFSRAEV
jgi:hypothetical protein